MRLALALAAVLIGASAANAQVVQDRYGPPRARPAAAEPLVTASLAPYQGRMLNWSSRRAPTPSAPLPAAAQPPPGPDYLPPSRPLPDSLYSPALRGPLPAAAPQPRAAAAPVQSRITPQPAPRPQPVEAVPPRAALAPAPAPTAVARQAAPSSAPPRFYSLHRQYGMSPDAIPPQSPGPRYVLIGPAAEPTGKAAQKAASDDDGPAS